MPILRLAYTTQFLLALLALFFVWSEVGGQTHLDLMPWYLKLILGGGAAFATVKATSAAVSHQRAWNPQTLRWVGILLALLVGCGLASYYVHLYGEEEEDGDESQTSGLIWQPGWDDRSIAGYRTDRWYGCGMVPSCSDAYPCFVVDCDLRSSGFRMGAKGPSPGSAPRAKHDDAVREGADERDSAAAGRDCRAGQLA